VNPDSIESKRVRSSSGPGVLGVHTKTFSQFLSIKCFEILRRLRARQELEPRGSFTFSELTREFASAEMDAADFIDAAYGLVDDLLKGETNPSQ